MTAFVDHLVLVWQSMTAGEVTLVAFALAAIVWLAFFPPQLAPVGRLAWQPPDAAAELPPGPAPDAPRLWTPAPAPVPLFKDRRRPRYVTGRLQECGEIAARCAEIKGRLRDDLDQVYAARPSRARDELMLAWLELALEHFVERHGGPEHVRAHVGAVLDQGQSVEGIVGSAIADRIAAGGGAR